MNDSERAHLSAQTTRFFGYFEEREYGPLKMYLWALVVMISFLSCERSGRRRARSSLCGWSRKMSILCDRSTK